jgi:hypothetical protein
MENHICMCNVKVYDCSRRILTITSKGVGKNYVWGGGWGLILTPMLYYTILNLAQQCFSQCLKVLFLNLILIKHNINNHKNGKNARYFL